MKPIYHTAKPTYFVPPTREFEPINHAPPERRVPVCIADPACTRPVVRLDMCARHLTLEGL